MTIAVKFRGKYAVGVVPEQTSVSMSPEVGRKLRDSTEVWQRTATDLLWDEALRIFDGEGY